MFLLIVYKPIHISFVSQFPLITKGGARIEVLLNATTRRDEQGSVIGKLPLILHCGVPVVQPSLILHIILSSFVH